MKERINLDFWTPARVGKTSTIMVAPEFDRVFIAALESAKIQYSVMSDDVQKLVDYMPKMKLHNKAAPDAYHSMDWEDYHDLATMYEYLDYLEGIWKEGTSDEMFYSIMVDFSQAFRNTV